MLNNTKLSLTLLIFFLHVSEALRAVVELLLWLCLDYFILLKSALIKTYQASYHATAKHACKPNKKLIAMIIVMVTVHGEKN